MKRLRVLLALGPLAALASCGGIEGDPAAVPEPPTTSTEPSADTATTSPRREPEPIVIELPIVEPISLPDLTSLAEVGDVVSAELGAVGSGGGLDVVGATCTGENQRLVYSGTTQNGIFDIERDGSGVYYSEQHDGLVTLEVTGDGIGSYYDGRGDGLFTITTAAGGSGEYYVESPTGLTTVTVDGLGGGEYYAETPNELTTIRRRQDGSGELYRSSDTGTLSILARRDGSGEYIYTTASGDRTVLVHEPGGSWFYEMTTEEGTLSLTVATDGSAHYERTGEGADSFDVRPDGLAIGRDFVMPERPEFLVAAEFPRVDRLTPLSPTCATVIRFDARVLFDFGESSLRPDAVDVLAEVVATLNDLNRRVEINGHTDDRGDEADNEALSLARATAVEQALRELGLAVETAVNGFGETQPIAPNATPDGDDNPAGRQLNRRVEIVIREDE